MHPGSKRLPFDQSGPFVARKPVTMNGKKFVGGEDFPVDLADPRRLRQLYDTRRIDMKTEDDVRRQSAKRLFPEDWRTMQNRELFPLITKAFNVKPRNRVEAFKLLERYGAA